MTCRCRKSCLHFIFFRYLNLPEPCVAINNREILAHIQSRNCFLKQGQRVSVKLRHRIQCTKINAESVLWLPVLIASGPKLLGCPRRRTFLNNSLIEYILNLGFHFFPQSKWYSVGGFLIGLASPVTILCSTKSVPWKSLLPSLWKTCLYFAKIGSITDFSA
jgi:hypothetical protein